MNLGLANIFVILLFALGPLKTAIAYATLTSDADRALRRAIAIKNNHGGRS